MPPLQGYVEARWQDMVDVFGQPERVKLADDPARMQWKLDGGTILRDQDQTVPVEQVILWAIRGWGAWAVDQVIGIAERKLRFAGVWRPRRSALEVVGLRPASVRCSTCGEAIVMSGGRWLHYLNPEMTGNDNHDAAPATS